MKKLSAEKLTLIRLNQAIEICHNLYNTEKLTGVRNTPLFLGPPGQGKSAIVEEFVGDLNRQREERFALAVKEGKTEDEAAKIAGARWVCMSYRLSQCDPTDLKGVPKYVQLASGHEVCSNAPPHIFPMEGLPDSAEGHNVLIFLDELPQANPTIQNLAANIIDGKVGDFTIDMKRSFIVCAGNRKEDRAATYDTPMNVGNRLIRFSVKTTYKEWKDWAIKNKQNSLVIGFLEDKSVLFNEEPPQDGYTYGTPRSWHKLSCQLNYLEDAFFDEEGVGLQMAQGTVGLASATAFYQFAKAARNNFSLKRIIKGVDAPVPNSEQRDILFSLILEATYVINNWVEEAVVHTSYVSIPVEDTEKRVDTLMTILGSDKVKGINNIFKWISSPGIDPAFQVILNKYQSRVTADNLRIAILLRKEFKESATAYEAINKALITQK